MMTAVMLGGLALFLVNKKWAKITLICLVPVCVLMAYYGDGNRLNMYAVCAGMTMIAASPFFEWIAERLLLRLECERTDHASGDDIVDNKTKWRLIIAGYVIFVLFAVFSIISIIRLNAKINTLYGFTQDLDQRIEDVSDTQ